MSIQPTVSWTPDRGGYYPVHCGRCNRVIGSVETLAGNRQRIKILAAMHFCSPQHVHVSDRILLIQAQETARKRNFAAANELLKKAYMH